VQFITDKLFNIEDDVVFTLEAPELSAMPKVAKLKWHKPLAKPLLGYLCGVTFVKENLGYSIAWEKWMEANIEKLSEAGDNSILARYLGHEDA
jgi:hypothetical protein